MATIRKRGPYQWQAIVRRKGYPQESKTFEIKADAEAWSRMIENEMDRGVFVSRAEAESTTLHEALERYGREITPHKKGAKRESDRIKQIQRHKLADRYLAGIQPKHIAEYRDERMNKDGVGPSTYQKEHALLSHVFTIARKEWGMVSLSNPCSLVRKPPVSNARDMRVPQGKEDALLEECRQKHPELAVAVTLAIETAMRRSEIMTLERDQVHRDKRLVHLDKTKNGDERHVPLSSRALAAIDSLPARLDGRLFGITADNVTEWFSAAAKAVGIQGLRFHDLRHEATSRLFESGLFRDLEIASITGHKTLQMLKRYAHFRVEELAKRLG